MRCVIVNGAMLKAEAFCAHCGKSIGGTGYVRDIASRLIYCDFACYSGVASANPLLLYRAPVITGTRGS